MILKSWETELIKDLVSNRIMEVNCRIDKIMRYVEDGVYNDELKELKEEKLIGETIIKKIVKAENQISVRLKGSD